MTFNKLNLINNYDQNIEILKDMNRSLIQMCKCFNVNNVPPLNYTDFCNFAIEYGAVNHNNIFMFLEQYVIDNSPELFTKDYIVRSNFN